MVHKLFSKFQHILAVFENDVELYGTQTELFIIKQYEEFENDVELYGTQTTGILYNCATSFENDVELYGTQTERLTKKS